MAARTVSALFLLLGIAGRAAALDAPIVFVQQTPTSYNFATISDIFGNFLGFWPPDEQPVGGNLFRLDPGSGTPVNLTNLSGVAVRNPEVSFDAARIVFSMKTSPFGRWQIYEINADGSGLRQVSRTDSNDTEPAYLPDGRIVFASDRLRIADPYEALPSGQLYVMQPDGSDLAQLTSNPGGDFNPTVLPTGEIAFVQWDVKVRRTGGGGDRLEVNRFLLWKMNPDGSNDAHPIYGTHFVFDFDGGFVHTRALRDGSGRFVTTVALEFFTWGAGALALIDPVEDQTDPQPTFITPADGYDEEGSHTGGRYRDPFPLADGRLLVSYAPGKVFNSNRTSNPPDFGLYTIDLDGQNRTLVYDSPLWDWEAVEVVARTTPAVIPPTIDPNADWGILNSMDVTLREINEDARNGDIQGTVDLSDVTAVYVFKGVRAREFYPDFPGYRQVQPLLLGRVPIQPDGSFAAKVPANEPLVWSLVDARGREVLRERFWNQVRPGQTQTCSGCHSPHDGSLGNTSNAALASPVDLASVDLTRLLPGGGSRKRACYMEWATDQPREPRGRSGIPRDKLVCRDGEVGCDHDAVVGQCTFRLGVCLNVVDGRVVRRGTPACTPTDVAEVRLRRPSRLRPRDDVDETIAVVLSDAINALGPRITERGSEILPGTPATTQVCAEMVDLVVPVGRRSLSLAAVSSAGEEDRNRLLLQCLPAYDPYE